MGTRCRPLMGRGVEMTTDSGSALEHVLLNALLENIRGYVYFKDREGRFIRIGRHHARFLGLHDAAEAIGKTARDFFSEDHARKAFEDEQYIIRTGQPLLDVEERESRPDRPDTWALTSKMPLRDQDGNIIGTFGIARDITEYKQANERILSLARFPDEDPDPVMRVTPYGTILYANKASESGGLVERKISSEELRMFTRAWESGEKQEIVIVQGSKSYLVAIVPCRAEGYINLYARDVTEEKALLQRLNQVQKMDAIGQLVGGVAHDFNNILQAITGYGEMLAEQLSDQSQQPVAEIKKAVERAAALVRQLLAFSRKQTLRPGVIDMKELVSSMEGMLTRVIGEDVELEILVDGDTGNVLADQSQIEQVLMNLAVNARDAMPTGGKLIIETSNRNFDEAYVRDHPGARAGEYVRIAVSDTGVGMDQDTLSRIYEPFFTTKEIGKGTGLGLSTVYGIVKQSGGYINCYSEIGKGTTFTIYLPRTSKALVAQGAESVTTPPGGRETILLVDDEPAVRTVTSIALRKAGYSVIEASDGEQALAEVVARRMPVELLITDVVMPRMNARELAGRLREISPRVRVLFISGYTANVISHHGILEAGFDYLQKPFNSAELLTRVRDILDRP